MALYSSITITFTRELIADEYVEFARALWAFGDSSHAEHRETWKSLRTKSGEVEVTPTPGGTLIGETSAIYYTNAFKSDFYLGGLYDVKVISPYNVVVITSTSPDWYFLNVDFPTGINAVINNISPNPFKFTSYSYETSLVNTCSNFIYRATLTKNVEKLTIDNGTPITATYVSPFDIELTRGIDHLIDFEDDISSVVSVNVASPGVLSVQNLSIILDSDISGTTVTFKVINNELLTLQYSLNNIDWQTSNVYSSQLAGNYTVYIKDQYGCQIQKDYVVETLVSTRVPYIFISESNSIGLFNMEDIDGILTYRNDKNTLSCQDTSEFTYLQNVLLTNQDTTTIQFKSNYDTPTAKLIKEDLTEIPLTLIKQTENINRFYSLDCQYYKYKDGKVGLYFISGNVYNETNTIIDQYALNGNLPEFATIGTFIDIDGLGFFKIKDIVYDSNIGKKAIIIDLVYNGVETTAMVSSYYDLLNFEIYEFTVDWATYGNGIYNLLLDNTDINMGTVEHLSEKINILDSHIDTVAINYYNSNNRDIFYKYGIEHFIRVPFIRKESKIKEENDINIGDNNVVLINSQINKLVVFYFDVLIESLMIKLSLALSSEFVFINGVGYLKDSELEIKNIENTNLYEITATMIQTGFNYNSINNSDEGMDAGVIPFDIPTIITDGTNFIKS